MPTKEEIAAGLCLNWMSMTDAHTGKEMWKSQGWTPAELWGKEVTASVPRGILQCQAVTRDINFSSAHQISKLRLEQKILLNDIPIEEWRFSFGFVIPESTNTWSSTIEAAGEGNMLSAEVLSGHTVIETVFYDEEEQLCSTRVRLFYV